MNCFSLVHYNASNSASIWIGNIQSIDVTHVTRAECTELLEALSYELTRVEAETQRR